MLLYSWDEGMDVCVDLTGSSPLTQSGMIDFVPGRAVIEDAQRKHVKYEAKCADIGYGFLLFSFSSFGELEKDEVTLLNRIRKLFVTQDIRARLDVCVDLTRFSSLMQIRMVDSMPGRAVIDAAQRKRVMYKAKCAYIEYDFLPFSLYSLKELEGCGCLAKTDMKILHD
ncbi:hypothetical protein Tco_1312039 [Tanacetum coccineum]